MDNVYDEIGRLKTEKRTGHSKLRTDYTYNLRSWTKDINGPLFHQTLTYQESIDGTAPCYNGNISSMTWKSGGSAATNEMGYRFTYDGLSRMKDAIYGETNTLSINQNRFNEQITGCDKMGNILGLLRYGQTSATGYGLVDNLNLVYNGNQLQSVDDHAPNSVYGNGMEFKDNANQPVEYGYDKNGNLTKDLNKNISNIRYNLINLPSQITFGDGNAIDYEYGSDGRKLRTVYQTGNTILTTDYCGNAIYENGSLKMLLNESGYYSFQDNKFHFYIKDHQGNIRVVADKDGQVDEVNDYYPFGGLMSNGCNNVQPYKYNGKELDRKGGLDWYDYGARMYDAALGRWHAVDLVAESFCNLSPYQYVKNIPHKLIDPSGMVPVDSLTWETFNPNEDVIELNEVQATAASPYVNETVGGLTYSVNVFTGRRRLIGETGLKNIYPEYDLIAFARFLAGQGAKKGINQAGRIATSRTASNRLSQNAIDKGIQYAMKRAKFDHIFGKSAHNLGALTARLGGERNVVSATLNALNNGGHLGTSGIMQEITVDVAGSNVVVRFVVHDGFPKIGTMYIP